MPVTDLTREQVEFLAVSTRMATPEFIRNVHKEHPDAIIYALRLDRGLSPAKIMQTIPGTHWDEERGLDEHQYIVPGAGGVGEILNNAWV